MPIFTDHLRAEIQAIRNGLSQLETARNSIPDLRLAVYTMRLLFKRIHLAKLETVLYRLWMPAAFVTASASTNSRSGSVTATPTPN